MVVRIVILFYLLFFWCFKRDFAVGVLSRTNGAALLRTRRRSAELVSRANCLPRRRPLLTA